MRLITFPAIILLLTISFKVLPAQPKIDTVSIDQTFLEERHLRFMYNYAFTHALFNRRHFVPKVVLNGRFTPNSSDSILVLENTYRIDESDIKLFNRSDSILINKITHLKDSDKVLQTKPLVSQYEFDYLNSGSEDLVKNSRFLIESIEDHKKPVNAAVMFSAANLVGHRVYIRLTVFSIIVPPTGMIYERFIYEFEWCESLRIVYPNRVSGRLFDATNGYFSRKLGGTIKIESPICP